METKTVKSFVNETIARLQGDDNKVVAERNYRKANSAVKGQISSLESKKVDAEVKVEEAAEALENAKYPTTPIDDNASYIRNIVKKQEALDEANDELTNINNSLGYFNDLYKEFNP